jgi:glycosyltransferase involved in cell wall biosynthesis
VSLTAAVIARDEEDTLGDCLRSLAFADERLVVLDSATRDRTRTVAEQHGARVEERAFDNFASQREAALGLATGDWVLFVDADERVTPALRDEILARLADPGDPLRVVHELALVDGPLGYLHQPLVHFNYRDVGEFVRKQERYCGLEAQRWLATFGRPRRRALIGQPAREFWRRYVELQGFREGGLGLLLSVLLAYYAGRAVFLARRLSAGRPA